MSTTEEEKRLRKEQLCRGCQLCCTVFIVYTDKLTEEERALCKTRRIRVVAVDGPAGPKDALVLHLPCPYLDREGGCIIYDKRPKACRDYDGRLDPVLQEQCRWRELEYD